VEWNLGMAKVLLTVDTELSALLHQRGFSPRANFESSILGRTEAGDYGIIWQMEQLNARGLTGVYFIDPMPALVYGIDVIRDIVALVLQHGHEVQLHCHTEWLEWAEKSPVAGRTGRNIGDFSLEDQMVLLALARDLLEEAGSPALTAFRAGNFGANDDTLRALAAIGLSWDSSFNSAWMGNPCAIALSADEGGPILKHGIAEIPVSGIQDRPGGFRPAQICALSSREMRDALEHAAGQGDSNFVIVTHSFEMLSRNRARPNRLVMARFEAICDAIARNGNLATASFADLDVTKVKEAGNRAFRLGSSLPRTAWRMAEQAVGTWVYERQLRPA
jgi:hypothetical protein